MAGAMARGWAAGAGGPDAMVFCDLDRERAAGLAAQVGGEEVSSLGELSERCDALLLAVKPSALEAVAGGLRGNEGLPLLSVMAATPAARVRDAFAGAPVLRAMPNQPVEVRCGVICHVAPDPGAEQLLELLPALGSVHELPEPLIEPAMAVMSCAPAYAALFAKSLADAGTSEGLEAALSLALVRETMAGTASMLAVRSPDAVMRAVAPPGGATEAGLEALEAGGMRAAVVAAVAASLERFR